MVEITLFEVHVEDASFDANAEAIANAPLSGLSKLLGRGSSESDTAETVAETPEERADATADSSGVPGAGVGKLLLLVAVLAAAAVVARRVVGGRAETTAPESETEGSEIAEIDVGE